MGAQSECLLPRHSFFGSRVRALPCHSACPRAAMAAPQPGDKILVLKQRFLDLILREDKDLELRHQRLTPGWYYLASGRVVQGVADVGVAFEVEDDFWFRSLLHRHQLDTASKPYKKTWAHPLTGVQRMDPSVPYALVRGQQGTARFRPMHEGGERSVRRRTL